MNERDMETFEWFAEEGDSLEDWPLIARGAAKGRLWSLFGSFATAVVVIVAVSLMPSNAPGWIFWLLIVCAWPLALVSMGYVFVSLPYSLHLLRAKASEEN